MVSRRTLAWKYGSRAELAMIVERHALPIDTSSPDDVLSPLWQATHSSEWLKCTAAGGAVGRSGVPDVGVVRARRDTTTTAMQAQTVRTKARRRGCGRIAISRSW